MVGPAAGEQQPVDILGWLQGPLRRAVLAELMKATPQRATDIFYEDDDTIYAMRKGVQYAMVPPASLVWKRLGQETVGNVIDQIAAELKIKDPTELRTLVLNFLFAADQAGLVMLYGKEEEEIGAPAGARKG